MTEVGIQLPNGPMDTVEAARVSALGLKHHLDLHHWIGRSTGIVGPHIRVDVRGSDLNGMADARLVTDLYNQYPGIKSWRIRNEPNIESPGINTDDWYGYLSDLAESVPDNVYLFNPAISPGPSNWLSWFRAAIKAGGFKGQDAHIYGSPTEFETVLKQIRDLYSGTLYVTEYNFGAGRQYDLQQYADDWPHILELCNTYKVALCFVFIWRWQVPDMVLPTTVNVVDTPFEAVLKRTNMKVALIPSNQDKNITVDGSNEMAQVAPFMEILLAQAPNNVTAKIFVPQPESLDTYKYQGLYDIQKQVGLWQPDLAINIHTDSGFYTHTGTYSDGTDIIKKLCADLCPRLQKFFNGPCAQGNYSDYIFATVKPAILLELGSHQLLSDIQVLKQQGVSIAIAIWSGVKMIFGNQTDIPAHLDFLWAGANQMKATSTILKQQAQQLIEQANQLDQRAAENYERIVAIKTALGLQ